MKWDKLKEYIEKTLRHGENIERASDQEKGFMYGFEDIFDKIRNLEGEEETNSKNKYWIPEEDKNGINSNVTVGKEYRVVWDSSDQEEVIIDDLGSKSVDFMWHSGSFIEKNGK